MPNDPDIRIRPAAPGDAEALAPLMVELGYPTTPEQMRERLDRVAANPMYGARVAEVDGRVAGFVGMTTGYYFNDDPPYCRVLSLVVGAADRRRGIAGRLMEAAEAWAREQGASNVHLTTALHRGDAHEFYARRGYERTGFRYYKKLG